MLPESHIVGFLAFGLLIGAVGRSFVATRDPWRWSWELSMFSGVAGALLGGLCGDVSGLYRDDAPAAFVMALLGAFTLVGAYHAAAAQQRRRLIARAC
jgi:uncharacterized membrane protein YeaQ/YmgE (transglycosylase-associated protein family)